MEGRDCMSLAPGGMVPGPNSFSEILQRGIVVPPMGNSSSPAMPASPMLPPGLHAPAPMRPTSGIAGSNSSPSTNFQYVLDIGVSGMGQHPVPIGMHTGGAPTHIEPIFKRKRGRPRKYGPDGSMALALVSHSAVLSSPSPLQKRGRGRPPGSGRKQQLAALGRWMAGTAGVGFTPHVISIAGGEDVAMKIMSFSQQGPRAICILSVNGAVSNATLRQPATSGGTVTYEGRFEILSLSGSFLPVENNGISSRTGGLSITLAGPDGRVVGGGVAGLLMAAGPVQVIVGSFLCNDKKLKEADQDGSGPTDTNRGSSSATMPKVCLPTSYDDSSSIKQAVAQSDAIVHLPQNHTMATNISLHGLGWSTKHAHGS